MTGPCRAAGCTHPARSRGLCVGHYARLRAGKALDTPLGAPGPPRGEPIEPIGTHLALTSKRELEAYAKREGVSLYALLRRIVEEWLEVRRR